jgi:hypothetical protein
VISLFAVGVYLFSTLPEFLEVQQLLTLGFILIVPLSYIDTKREHPNASKCKPKLGELGKLGERSLLFLTQLAMRVFLQFRGCSPQKSDRLSCFVEKQSHSFS